MLLTQASRAGASLPERSASVLAALGGLFTVRLAVVELIAWGTLYFTFPVLLSGMTAELAWSQQRLGLGYSVALAVSGGAAPWSGAWLDRYGSRWVMSCGVLVGTVGLIIWGQSQTLPSYLCAWALIGCAMSTTLYPSAFAAVVRASPEQSRRGIQVITLVGAMASTVFLPLTAWVQSLIGWRGATWMAAALLAATLSLLLPRHPEPNHRRAEPSEGPNTASSNQSSASLRTLAVAMMLVEAATVAMNTYLVLFLVGRGMTLEAAAAIAALIGVAKLVGRAGLAIPRRVSAHTLLRLAVALQAGALLLPLISDCRLLLSLMVLLLGASAGARTVLAPILVVELFGAQGFGKRNGKLQLVTTAAKAGAPVAFAWMLQRLGDGVAWPLLAVPVAAAAVLIGRVGR